MTEETIKALAEEYYKKLTEKTPMKGIGSHEHIYFTYGVEWAFEKLREGTERVECYLPVEVRDEFPEREGHYFCRLDETSSDLLWFNKSDNTWERYEHGEYVIAEPPIKWLKKTVLTVVPNHQSNDL